MITLSFWGNLKTKQPFVDALFKALGEYVVKINYDEEIVHYVLKDRTLLTLGVPENAKTTEKFQTQVDGLSNYFSKVPTDKPKIRSNVIEQISLFNTMLGIAFEDTGVKDRLNHILASVLVAAGSLKGVVLLSNMDLLDGKGNMLFSHDGQSDYTEFTPHKFADNIFNTDFEPSMEDEERYSNSNKLLQEKSIPIPENATTYRLKKVECKLRPIEEICKRVFALLEVAIYSACMLDDTLGKETAFIEIGNLNDKYHSINHVSLRELEYLNTTQFSKYDGEIFIWRYESLLQICWCLGLVEHLDEPNKVCNSSALMDIICSFDSIEKLIIASNLRDIDVLLQEHDKIMRYHLACIEAYENEETQPFTEVVVAERHLALSWVLTVKNGKNWDEIEETIFNL